MATGGFYQTLLNQGATGPKFDPDKPWEFTEHRRKLRAAGGQLDLAMMSGGALAALLSSQRTRRRGYSGTILSGLGLDEERPRRKTLLGG